MLIGLNLNKLMTMFLRKNVLAKTKLLHKDKRDRYGKFIFLNTINVGMFCENDNCEILGDN